ncbi:MAG: DUF2069 domain-containing protein [Glaciecola sp.]|jgi:uncharacterized membrane protein
MQASFQPHTLIFKRLALYSFIGLFVWVAVWQFFLVSEQSYSSTFIFLFYLLPLLFPAKGIIQGKPYTHAWASFVVLYYMMHGITAWYAVPAQWLYALIELMLATGMFVGCSGYARLRGREIGTALPKLKDVMAAEKKHFEGE